MQKGGRGIIASGFCLVNSNCEIIKEDCVIEKDATNNYGELKAIRNGIVECLKLDVKNIKVFSDSEIAVKCLNGEYSVNNENIKPVYLEIKELVKQFDSCEFIWIKRDLNMYTDYLTAVALDGFRKSKKPIINKEICLKQLKEFIGGLNKEEVSTPRREVVCATTGFKDIDTHEPKYIRSVLSSGASIIYDRNGVGEYLSRENNEKFNDLINSKQMFEHHISLLSYDGNRALLVYESDKKGGDVVINKLFGLLRDRGFDCLLKHSGSRSLQILIPIEISSVSQGENAWDYFFNFLGIEEKEFIDTNLRNIATGQIRGVDSLHLKTYDTSKIVGGSRFTAESYKHNKLILKLPDVENKIVVSENSSKKFEPIKDLGEKENDLIEVARNLEVNERSKICMYVASKLESNENNKKFIKKFIESVGNKTGFSVDETYGKCLSCMGKNYGKKFVDKLPHTNKVISCLFGFRKVESIHRGVVENWEQYEKWINGIEDTKKRKQKLNEFVRAKEFMESRGLFKHIPDGRNGVQVANNLINMEINAGVSIGDENWSCTGTGDNVGMVIGKLSRDGLDSMKNIFKFDNRKIKTFKCPWKIGNLNLNELGEFALMNKGNKDYTQVIYDVETSGDKQNVVLVGAVNISCKRIVLASVNKRGKVTNENGEVVSTARFEKCFVDGWEILRCDVMNGWEAVMLADAESYTACVVNSLMRQGDNTPEVINDLFNGKIKVNTEFVDEILINKRRSMWVAHNSNFDINKLNVTSRNGLLHIKNDCVVDRELKLNVFGNKTRFTEYSWKPKFKLGNLTIGAYFTASTRKYGLWEKPEIRLQPIQNEADSYVYALDSLLIAKALQKSRGSLKDLGEEYKLETKKSDSTYNFTGEEIWKKDKHNLNETNYLINDLISTYGVWVELTKELDVVPSLLRVVGVDENRIRRHRTETGEPYVYRIYSTASISKIFNSMIHAESYEEWKTKNSNIKIYDPINDLFKSAYAGGRVEVFRKGYFKGEMGYWDFASLYPHASQLTDVEMLQKDIFNKKLEICSDLKRIREDFWKMVEVLERKIKNKEKIEKSDFMKTAVVNVAPGFDMRISRKGNVRCGVVNLDSEKNNRMDLICEDGSFINCSVYDLCYGVLEKVIKEKIPIEKLKKKLLFNTGIMLIPSKSTSYDEDIHTKLYGERNAIKQQMKKCEDENTKKHLENQSQLIKIILNSSYGLTAEFNEGKGGQFYNPILACSITSMARLMNNLIEIACGYDGVKMYYTDTDSAIMDKAGEKVCDLFSNICELKNELKEGTWITDLFINSPKEYAYFTNDEKDYAVKTHGVGARSRSYKPVLEKLFRALKDGKSKEVAIDEAVGEVNLLRSFNFTHTRSTTNTLYTNLANLVNKRNDVLGEYEGFRLFQYGKNDLFITDVDYVTKGTFGKMFSLGEPKIYLFSVKYGFDEKKMVEILEKIPGIPAEKRKLILERVASKYSEKVFLKKYLSKDEDNVKRKILDDGTTEPYKALVNEKMDVSFNEDLISFDGVEYCGIAELPDFDFSSKMEADLSTFYSKAIVSLGKGLSYWLAKSNNGEEEARKVFDKRNSDLLIPQKKNEILVPLNMVEVPETESEIIDAVQKAEKINSDKLKGFFECVGTSWSMRKECFEKKTRNIKPEVLDIILTELKPRNVLQHDAFEFNKKKWWFEVCSYMSNKHNAILRVNVIVGNPPKIRFYLWINPHDPLINVDLWKATYTDLAISSESVQKVIERVFDIGFGNARGESVLYDSVLSGFSRGSSYSLRDLKKNNRYFLDICYTLACVFIVKNAVKHMSLKIGRMDVSANVIKKVDKKVEGLVSAFLGNMFNNEMNGFLDTKCKNDNIERVKFGENIYASSNGYYAGLVNKKTKISQVVYNKSVQLDYKLIKQTRKKGYSKNMIKKMIENREKFKDIWRVEIQAYGSKAIGKVVRNHKLLITKLEKMLKVTIMKINRINTKELKEVISFNAVVKDVGVWLHEVNDSVFETPPDLLQLAV